MKPKIYLVFVLLCGLLIAQTSFAKTLTLTIVNYSKKSFKATWLSSNTELFHEGGKTTSVYVSNIAPDQTQTYTLKNSFGSINGVMRGATPQETLSINESYILLGSVHCAKVSGKEAVAVFLDSLKDPMMCHSG